MILPELPAIAIILIIEHIAIAKAMGRLYNYTVIPSQEIIASGAANIFSPFVGGYVCTGSFGASAVLSKAGVRTPLAGLFSALVLVLALYVLTAVFYYIPNAALAGLIIHAVCNLLTPPKNLHKYWQLSPIELLIWIVGVVLAIFDSLETSIYAGMALSIAVLLVRLARTRGRFVGIAKTRRATTDAKFHENSDSSSSTFVSGSAEGPREVFVPLDRKDATNPRVKVETPYPGVFVYRFSENYNYTNQAYHVDTLLNYIMDNSRRMSEEHFEKESDRLWNDPGPRTYNCDPSELPYLRALVFDFSAVNNIDVTSVQGLIDLRNTLERYSSPDTVEWHFANVNNRWTRRALATAGFGFPTSKNPEALGCWKPLYSIASTLNGHDEPQRMERSDEEHQGVLVSEEMSKSGANKDSSSVDTHTAPVSTAGSGPGRSMAALYGVDRPFFHVDLHEAVDSAVMDAKEKDKHMGCSS